MVRKPLFYLANVSCLEDAGAYAAAYDMVSDARKSKTDKYRQETDRRLSLGAEILMKKLLTDLGIRDPELAYDSNGAPYVADCMEIHISISHSGDYVLCAAADRRIGCDIECAGEMKDEVIERMSARFMTEDERNSLKLLDCHSDRLDHFYRIWTRKESYLKAIGLGLSALEDKIMKGFIFYEYDVAGYSVSLCIEAETPKPELKYMELL